MKQRPDSAQLSHLSAWRHFRQLQVQQLARKAGISDSFISGLERQKRTATRETITKLASALGITQDDLLHQWPQGMQPANEIEEPTKEIAAITQAEATGEVALETNHAPEFFADLSQGLTVHYVAQDNELLGAMVIGGDYSRGLVNLAIVAESPQTEQERNLSNFGVHFRLAVPYSASQAPGTWHWL